MCASTCVQRSEGNARVLRHFVFLFFWDRVSYETWNSRIQLDWFVRKPRGLSCLSPSSPSSAGITDAQQHSWLCAMGTKLNPTGARRALLIQFLHSPPQPALFITQEETRGNFHIHTTIKISRTPLSSKHLKQALFLFLYNSIWGCFHTKTNKQTNKSYCKQTKISLMFIEMRQR